MAPGTDKPHEPGLLSARFMILRPEVLATASSDPRTLGSALPGRRSENCVKANPPAEPGSIRMNPERDGSPGHIKKQYNKGFPFCILVYVLYTQVAVALFSGIP
jgi:hypothetical protein